jgi:hypothetical protein
VIRDYLKAAFWTGLDVPGLGRIPLNALAVLGFGILGFGHEGFWLLGAGLEAGYLTLLATHPRFQRAVDARRTSLASADTADGQKELAARLSPDAQRRLAALNDKIARALEAAREAHADPFDLASRREAFGRLTWIYLKLLVARHQLQATQASADVKDLKRRIADLETAASSGEATAALRQSRSATLDLLRQRLQNLERCGQTLQEVESDLQRIEAQVDLAVESAGVLDGGGGAATAANLELASEILGEGLDYGDLGSQVAALDQVYAAPVRRQKA